MQHPTLRGRGTTVNPPNRFETFWYETGQVDDDTQAETCDDEQPGPTTQFFKDHTKSILTQNDSPDVGFTFSINPYRGCEHGCIYCYARPTHEYLGFSAGLDFETKIMVKAEAPNLLRQQLDSRRWKPGVIAVSGVTDCYQPIERKLKLTRRCLEVLAEFRNPVCIITKSYLVTRDIDILQHLAHYQAAAVFLSVTTLDAELAHIMEPRAATPARRLAAIAKLSEAGVPVGVLVCPVIPGLTDHEIPAIIQEARRAGAQFAGYNLLRLPYSVKDLFEEWLDTHLPQQKNKVLSKLRASRSRQLNEAEFGSRMTGEGVFAEQVAALFTIACKKAGLTGRGPQLSAAAFRKPTPGQLELFED
ncbi:MAG: PA0069 family radical SAM protein [Abitibacteriaceae bacterium]|nr:PA0069 family radical SAM protein [Abditibacteriaceae bacterium]